MWKRATSSLPSRPLPPPRPLHSDPSPSPSPLQQVLTSIERQTLEADRLRALTHPTPWFALLHSPSRAAWRSTDLPSAASPLAHTPFNLLQRSQRTNKQLRRTYGRIVEAHKALAVQRERERRTAAKFSRVEKREAGNLNDAAGRRVGTWNEARGDTTIAWDDDPFVSWLLSQGTTKRRGSDALHVAPEDPSGGIDAVHRTRRPSKPMPLAAATSASPRDKSVAYGPEQTATHLRYRFVPNYSIVRRTLSETQSLLGRDFRPKRLLDFGCGVGSSSAAALDVFGVSREDCREGGIEWVHSVDVSQSMRDAAEGVLTSVLENVPWGYEEGKREEEEEDEESREYRRIVREIKGEGDERSLERRRRRLMKWEQKWEIRKDCRTRLTFGESIVDSSFFYSQLSSGDVERNDRPDLPWQKQLNEQRQRAREKKEEEKEEDRGRRSSSQKGSFDLILCTYTLSELSGVASTLTAAALLWEKLAPGGVMVFVEPGTPDGFSTLRSVRSMLLECFPPQEIRNMRFMEEKRLLMERLHGAETEDEKDGLRLAIENLENGYNHWVEECQVIAPCTHNGQCPMSRHQKNHVKTNTRFGKYKMNIDADNSDEVVSSEGNGADHDTYSLTDENDNENDLEMEEEEERLMQELIDQGYDREELEEMMQMMQSLEEDDEDHEDASDSDNEFGADNNENEDDDFFEVDAKARLPSTLAQTDVFESSFCSFVHNFPGGTVRKKGEKFSYLVVQKRTPSDFLNKASLPKSEGDVLNDVDIVSMLAKSVHHVQGLKEELRHMAKIGRNNDNKSSQDIYEKSHHVKQLRTILDKAVEVEKEFLESTKDKLGMELLHGDDRRRGWGRLVRAPIKKKGHVLLDYCSGGCTGKSGCGSNVDGAQGRIIRQKVSRAWSARVAPGCYAAARKARWGGLWPDLSERVA